MAVFGLVSAVAGFVKVRYLIDKAIIDNMVFRCHYRITSAILFVCCIIVTANNLIGEPISCIHDGAVPTHVINTFCWVMYTFSIPRQQYKHIGTEVANYGLGNEYNNEKRFHSYYQWVPFMLFFQGILFYMPHWIWKNWEDGKVRMITDGIRGVSTTTVPAEERHARQSILARYVMISLRTHNTYAFGYFLCEALNFINVVGNIFFVDKFLGGAFTTYGTEVIKFSNMIQDTRYDPMIEIFPRVTKCTFRKFGPGGSPQKHDTLCILALNILNEKIYIFLWFWFIILSIISGLAILFSAILIMMPTSRERIIKRRFRHASSKEVERLVRCLDIGDFLLLHFLGQNISISMYSDMLQEICHNFEACEGGTPSAPSTMEMNPIHPLYPDTEKHGKETET